MTAKQLKRLRRSDLLEMLLTLSKENDRLNAELTEAKRQLEDKIIHIETAGSIAEAAMKLNGVFEAAQAACQQYIQSVQAAASNAQDNAASRQETE